MSIQEMYEAVQAGKVTLDEFTSWVYFSDICKIEREYSALAATSTQ